MRPLNIIQALEQMYIKTESGTKQEKQQKKTKTWSTSGRAQPASYKRILYTDPG